MAPSFDRMGTASGLDDRERDAWLHRLGEHYARGRLSADELDRCVQVVLAAETPTDLEAAVAEVPLVEEPDPPEVPQEHVPASAPVVPVTRRLVGWVLPVAGGLLVALVDARSNVAEFAVGMLVGLLGLAAHWWNRRAPRGQGVSVTSPVHEELAPVADGREGAPVDQTTVDQTPVEEAPVVETPFVLRPPQPQPQLPLPPQGRGDGTIPGQRTGH